MEFEATAMVDGERIPVSVMCELDGVEPLGLWLEDEHGNDVTEKVSADEYGRLYEKAMASAVESLCDAADMMDAGDRT